MSMKFREYTVSFSVRGEAQAKHVAVIFPGLTRSQSRMAARLTADKRRTSFDGVITGVDYDDLMHLIYSLESALECFSMAPMPNVPTSARIDPQDMAELNAQMR
jgi:hypothetical protein